MMLLLSCVCCFTACRDARDDESAAVKPVLDLYQEKKLDWSEQDMIDMFSDIRKEEWIYKECVVIPDDASGRVGAVLFQDNTHGTSNVAFFDCEGGFQQCGTYAELAEEPNFTYLGDGAVTFQLKAENGMTYHHTLTISMDGENVSFKAEDEFVK